MTLPEDLGTDWLLYRDYVRQFWLWSSPFPQYGLLQLPYWQKWSLSVGFDTSMSAETFRRLVNLQDLVSFVLSCDDNAAQDYLDGKLMYYEIVEELEEYLGKRLTQ